MKLNKSVEVKELPKMTVAYIRHIGPYKGDDKLFESIWNRLFSWAGPRGLIGGKELLKLAIEDAKSQGKDGLVTVVGTTKFHFMSDTKWLLKQGFETYEKLSSGFSLLVRKINP